MALFSGRILDAHADAINHAYIEAISKYNRIHKPTLSVPFRPTKEAIAAGGDGAKRL